MNADYTISLQNTWIELALQIIERKKISYTVTPKYMYFVKITFPIILAWF